MIRIIYSSTVMTYALDELQQSSFVALFNVHAVLKVYIIPLGILSHYNMGGGGLYSVRFVKAL